MLTPLSYGTRTRFARRRRAIWLLIWSAVILLVVWKLPKAIANMRLLVLQHSVLKGMARTEQIVCVSGKREEYLSQVTDHSQWSEIDRGGVQRNRADAEWSRYQIELGLSPDANRGSLYVGNIFNPSGQRRILALQFFVEYPMVRYTLISPGTLFNRPHVIAERWVRDGKYVLGLLDISTTRNALGPLVYSATFDESTPTRISMRLMVAHREATMYFTLDDQDQLSTSLRDPKRLAEMEIDDGADQTEFDHQFFQKVLNDRDP